MNVGGSLKAWLDGDHRLSHDGGVVVGLLVFGALVWGYHSFYTEEQKDRHAEWLTEYLLPHP